MRVNPTRDTPAWLFVETLIWIDCGAQGRNRTGTEVALQRILSPLRLPIPPPGLSIECRGWDVAVKGRKYGGWGRIRTGVHGFAGRCITTLLPSHSLIKKGRTMPSPL